MAHFRKLPGVDPAGYDETRNLQVVPVARTTRIYLVAGGDLTVETDDTSVATVAADSGDNRRAHSNPALTPWEKSQNVREVRLRGVAAGSTKLRALINGTDDWVQPMDVVVVTDPDARRVGAGGSATVSEDVRTAVQGMSMRDAVIMIAEDQLHSAICQTDGFGRYDVNPEYNWCGAFAHWCWKKAAMLQGRDSPFGTNNDKLLSPQKAISWAMEESSPGQLLRYSGGDPFKGGKAVQEYREIGYSGYTLEPGDIVLLRKDSANGWKHMCMVHSYEEDNLVTIDGNQGAGQCIKIVHRDSTAKLKDGSYALVYVHVLI